MSRNLRTECSKLALQPTSKRTLVRSDEQLRLSCTNDCSLARSGRWQMGRACPLCPSTSDINLLRYRERAVDFDARIADGESIFMCPAKSWAGPEIAGAPIDLGRL